jgi:hypothetical protein
MTCRELEELIEPVIAGDAQMTDAARAHVEACPGCAGALASARRLETMLASVDVPPAPPAFTSKVLQRIRRERWRSEQHVDRLFNVAMVIAVIVVGGGVAAMLNLDALFTFTGTAWAVTKTGLREMMRDAAPAVATYAAAAGLLGSALVMWWWAERRWQF